MHALRSLIKDRRAVIGVVGLGYVGLPLASLLSKKGFNVLGADIKEEVVEKINLGKCPINEPGLDKILLEGVKSKRLLVTTDGGSVVRNSDIIFLVVQTPIDEFGKPDLSAFESAWDTVSKNLSPGKLLITESTIPPGTMRGVVLPILERSGLTAGIDFHLAYSPERAIPTKTLKEMQINRRIVGGLTEKCTELATLIYSQITSGGISKVDIETAEMVKIIENAYRDVNIAFANEIALTCEKLGVDSKTAIELANMHPRVNILNPGPGVGGHCIPKDPYFLLHSAREAGLELKLISSARTINESMPEHILDLIRTSLAKSSKDIQNAKVSILGIAYKGNTDDPRNSPAEPVVKSLMGEKCDVISHDPYVSQDFGAKFSNDLKEVIEGSDCVVFLADHDVYKNLNKKFLKGMLNNPSVIIDSRRIFEPGDIEGDGLRYLGIGRPNSPDSRA